MKEKEIEILTNELMYLLWSKKFSVRKAHQLLDCIKNVAKYRLQFKRAMTPESTALARWNLDESENRLSSCLDICGFCDIDRNKIVRLANNVEIE